MPWVGIRRPGKGKAVKTEVAEVVEAARGSIAESLDRDIQQLHEMVEALETCRRAFGIPTRQRPEPRTEATKRAKPRPWTKRAMGLLVDGVPRTSSEIAKQLHVTDPAEKVCMTKALGRARKQGTVALLEGEYPRRWQLVKQM